MAKRVTDMENELKRWVMIRDDFNHGTYHSSLPFGGGHSVDIGAYYTGAEVMGDKERYHMPMYLVMLPVLVSCHQCG